MRLRDAGPDDRERLRGLLADYLFEFDGRTEEYPYLDLYWSEPERLPFLIESGAAVAGLCLVRVRDGGWGIAEFTVVPGERRTGVGRAAVEAVAERAQLEGASFLEAKVHPGNREARRFWLAVGFREVERSDAGATVTRRAL